MQPPSYTPPPDPLLQQQQAQAEQDQTVALQDKLKGDTASIMSRYGAMIALGGNSTGSPLMSAATGAGSDFTFAGGANKA